MGFRRFVSLDPDGMAESGWLYVVVEAPTGVVHRHQYGGTACRQGRVEGFLVPVCGPGATAGLRGLFEGGGEPCGADARDRRLRALVAGIVYWACDGRAEEPHALRVDEGRAREIDEGWVPVVTPDGPGVLVWPNSD
ncbi:hypothetical protein VM98_12890 [Streptomyces rubellomurinus subsp. indigoferus]|nr:hypothetical protein VM98_12890 [Streptomyces rubellomurinus subsp. indigoferus]